MFIANRGRNVTSLMGVCLEIIERWRGYKYRTLNDGKEIKINERINELFAIISCDHVSNSNSENFNDEFRET